MGINKRTLGKMKDFSFIYIMILPVIIYFLIFTFYPLFLGVESSFYKTKVIGGRSFVNFTNYKELLTDEKFYDSVFNSIYIGGFGLIFSIIIATLLAIIINEIFVKKFKSIFQTSTYLPYLFSWSVVGGIWMSIFSTNGFANSILSYFGYDTINFFASYASARNIMVFTNVWKNCGYFTVLILAAIVSIDTTIYESAQIDGASRIKQIIYILIPNLYSTIKVLLLLGTINVFKTFGQIFVMTRPAYADAVRPVLLYIYEEGFDKLNIGKATSGATILLILTVIVTMIVRKLVAYDENYNK